MYVPRISWGGGYVSGLGRQQGRISQAGYFAGLADSPGRQWHPLPAAIWPAPCRRGRPYDNLWRASRSDHPEGRSAVHVLGRQRGRLGNDCCQSRETPVVGLRHSTTPSRVSGDTLFLSPQSFTVEKRPIDLYIGIRNLRPLGRLGVIEVIQTDTSNAPILRWRITQTGTLPPDTLLANIGIAGGDHYDVSTVVWEILAVDTSSGQRVYWTRDVILPPLIAGQAVPGTDVFTAFPSTGLQRNARLLCMDRQ